MKPENKAFLDSNRHHHDTLVKAFYLRHLDGNTRSEMQRIMSEEFQPGYTSDLWCAPCVSDMVLALYRRYDEWLVANPPPVEMVEPVIVNPSESIQVKANFPSHKNYRRR